MFNRKTREIDSLFDQQIDVLVAKMKEAENADQKSYYAYEIARIRDQKSSNKTKALDPNVLLSASANILGILLIIHHEQTGVLASKAMSFIPKIR